MSSGRGTVSYEALKETLKRVESDFPTGARVWNAMAGDQKGIVMRIGGAGRNGTEEWRNVRDLSGGEDLVDFNFGMGTGFDSADEFEEIFAKRDGAVVVFVAADVRDVDLAVSAGRRGLKMGDDSVIGAVVKGLDEVGPEVCVRS